MFKKKRKINKKKFLGFFKIKNRKNKKLDNFLVGTVFIVFFCSVLLLFAQLLILVRASVTKESRETVDQILLSDEQLSENLVDLKIDLEIFNEVDAEGRKKIAEKVRQLNYQNLHLLKLINAYENDLSIQFFVPHKKQLDGLVEEVRNVYLISSRLANKFDSILLFDEIDENQKSVIKKDFELFNEKINLVRGFSF